MNSYRDASPTQIAAFHRAAYGFSWPILGLILRSNHLISAEQGKIFMLVWQFLVCSAIPMLVIKSTKAEERIQTSPNLQYSRGAFQLLIDFFRPSPVSNKLPYRAFRATLGASVLPIFVGFFIVLLPLILVEMAICRLKPVRAKTLG